MQFVQNLVASVTSHPRAPLSSLGRVPASPQHLPSAAAHPITSQALLWELLFLVSLPPAWDFLQLQHPFT